MPLTIALDVFIIVESCIGGSGSASQSFGLTDIFLNIIRFFDPNSSVLTNPEPLHDCIRKLFGHFFLFGTSGLLTVATLSTIEDAYIFHKKDIIIVASCSGLFLALLSELIQYFVPGRVFAFTDVLIDFAGFISFGAILFAIVYFSIKKKIHKN